MKVPTTLGLALLLLGSSPARPQAGEPVPENLGFITFRPGNWDLYLISGKATPPKRLTDDPSLEYDPVVSPDGRYLVFCSERRGQPDLFVLDLVKGGEPRLLFDSPAMEDQAAFSPDGHLLAFVSTRDGTADVFVAPFRPEATRSLDEARNVTRAPGGDFRPVFSPDGRTLAWSSDRDGVPTGPSAARTRKGDVYLGDPAGGPVRRLTQGPAYAGSPLFLQDGTLVVAEATIDIEAHVSDRPSVFSRLVRLDPATGARTHLTPEGTLALTPRRLANGRLAFSTRALPHGPWQVRSLAPDGRDSRLETPPGFECWTPAPLPRGGFVCQGPGPGPADGPAGIDVLLGTGPFRMPETPVLSLPDRAVRLLAYRGFAMALQPDGRGIAFTETDSFNPAATEDALSRLLVADLAGQRRRVIHTWAKGQDPTQNPVYSRDGLEIAVAEGATFAPPAAEADVLIVPVTGGPKRRPTALTVGNDGFAGFFPDGRIVFRSGRTGDFEILLAEADGSRPRNLTRHPARDTFPAADPTTGRIVFSSNRDGVPAAGTGDRSFDLYLLEPGAPLPPRRLTDDPGQDAHASFSPDGQWVAFASERGGVNDEDPIVKATLFAPQLYGEIWALRLADGHLVRLTHNKWEDGAPSWAGSGR
jgi:Tol biopolymer transport system component